MKIFSLLIICCFFQCKSKAQTAEHNKFYWGIGPQGIYTGHSRGMLGANSSFTPDLAVDK